MSCQEREHENHTRKLLVSRNLVDIRTVILKRALKNRHQRIHLLLSVCIDDLTSSLDKHLSNTIDRIEQAFCHHKRKHFGECTRK